MHILAGWVLHFFGISALGEPKGPAHAGRQHSPEARQASAASK